MKNSWVDLLAKVKANQTAVATTTTETELFRIPIDANELADGRRIGFDAFFKYSTTGTPTIILGARLVARGAAATTGVLLAKTEAMTTPSGITDAMGRIRGGLTVRLDGATGTLMCAGEGKLYAGVAPTVGSATGAPATSAMGSAGCLAPDISTVDFTVDKDLLLTLKWSASSGSNTATGIDLDVTRRN